MRLFNVFASGHTLGQKLNFLKYLMSGKDKGVLSYRPLVISVVSTGRCTLNCDMCPTHSRLVPKNYRWRQNSDKDIGFDLFKRVLDRYPEALEVHIIGSGEPMLNPDFFRMVDYASQTRRMAVKTFSNGTTVGTFAGDMMISPLDGLTISINGHNRREFARMTGMREEVFDKICSDTRALINRKNKERPSLKVKLSFIIDRQNYRSMREMIDMGVSFGPDHIFLCSFLPAPYSGLTAGERLPMAHDREVKSHIQDVMHGLPAQVKRILTFPMLADPGRPGNKCRVHFEQLRIDGEGNIASCSMMLLDMSGAAHIDDDDPWNSAFFINAREKCLQGIVIDELCCYCVNCNGENIL